MLIFRKEKVGEIILIDDGKKKLEVTETNKQDTVQAKVIYGSPLSSNKGVNLPNTNVSLLQDCRRYFERCFCATTWS